MLLIIDLDHKKHIISVHTVNYNYTIKCSSVNKTSFCELSFWVLVYGGCFGLISLKRSKLAAAVVNVSRVSLEFIQTHNRWTIIILP